MILVKFLTIIISYVINRERKINQKILTINTQSLLIKEKNIHTTFEIISFIQDRTMYAKYERGISYLIQEIFLSIIYVFSLLSR